MQSADRHVSSLRHAATDGIKAERGMPAMPVTWIGTD
jgi:hypothetical protein